MTPPTFRVGQRVIVTHWKHSTPHTDMNGYYGHVTAIYNSRPRPMVDVSIIGRTGAEPRPHDLDPNGDDPWIFYADELEAVD